MFDAHLVSSGRAAPPAITPLRWPPPGLESVQGAAWRALAILTAGTGILIAPLLLSVATPQSFWSTGLFGASWWVPVAATAIGLLLVLLGLGRVARILLDGIQAVRQGHDWSTVAHVACDRRYDAGFLLQGHRQYAGLEERERRMLLSARMSAVGGYLLGLLWVAGSFSAGVVMATRGTLGGGTGLALFVLVPGGVLIGIGALAHGVEANASRAIGRAWRKDATRERKLVDEIGDWRADRATRLIQLPAATRRTLLARLATIALIAVGVLLPLPVVTLSLASAMGPVLASVAVPRYESSAARLARASLLTPYALPATGGMTALEAGEALHAVASIGRQGNRSAIERDPIRTFAPWPEVAPPATLPKLQTFGTQLIPRASSLTPDEVAYLERITAHPALSEYSRISRAPLMDVTGGRWKSEQLASASVFELPVARTAGLRDATHHHIARAVLQLQRGETEAAETTLREVISVGLLVARESPSMVDMLTGGSIAALGAAALQTFYFTTGRTAEGASIQRQNEGVDRADEFARALRANGDVDGAMQRAMAIASNDKLPRGLRWEALLSIQVGAGCLNPHTVVFGHGEDYRHWLETTRGSLVRYPTEQALFDLTLRGLKLPNYMQTRSDLVERVLGVTLGRTQTANACAALLTGLSSM